MDKKQVRVHALDAAIRLHPGMTNLNDLFLKANAIADYISPVTPPKKEPAKSYLFEEMRDLVKASESVLEFSKHCHVNHPVKGSIKFQPYPFQKHLLAFYQGNPRTVVNMARQMGKTTCIAIYALWFALFHDNKTVMVISSRYAGALEIMERIRFIYEQLPPHIQMGTTEYNKGAICFDNGTRIVARAAGSGSFRGLTISLTIIDELAYISHSLGPDLWDAMQVMMGNPTSRFILTSTPNFTGDLFHKVWQGSQTQVDDNGRGQNGIAPFFAPWDCHPDRDEAWATTQRNALGERAFAQEFECRFIDA
jgi:phage terminase large subunit-like protein